MRITRTSLAATALGLALGLAPTGGAQAQNFFERLFGIAPSRPEPPPPVTYGRPPPPPDGFGPPPLEERRAPVERAPARPIVLKQPSTDTVLGRDLKLNGSSGNLRLDRSGGGDFTARMTLLGRKSADSPDTCSIEIGGSAGTPLVNQGRPEGLQRFQLNDPACPMQFDLVDDAVLVKGPSEACVFVASGCRSDPNGLWGPEPAALLPRARDFETLRAAADKAARDNYRVMTQRAKPEGVRPVVAEQAAFSADRESVCKSYVREAATNFCNARFSEARAITLAARLGVSTTASTQSAEAPPQRRRTRIPVEEQYGIPPTEELMQQPR